jgi:hypothetical protein
MPASSKPCWRRLFPRYMFMILDLPRDRWRSVNGTYGVDRLLMRSGDPAGEVAHLLKEAGRGFAVASSNVTELKQRILQLARSPQLQCIMGARARTAFEQRWNRDIAVSSWEQLLDELVGSKACR